MELMGKEGNGALIFPCFFFRIAEVFTIICETEQDSF